MIRFSARYFDGVTSQATPVEVALWSDQLDFRLADQQRKYPRSELKITPRLGNLPRKISLPDGAQLETADSDALEAEWGESGEGMVARLERGWIYAIAALLISLLLVWSGVRYGVPMLAKGVAFALPVEVDSKMGEGALTMLDEAFFSASQLSTETRQRLNERFSEMVQRVTDGHGFRLEFRQGGDIEANALALPSGIIVVTDELVQLVEDDDELVAVLAHELGHVVQRHALRRLFQDSVTALLISSVTGDITSLTALSATLPTLLVEAKYSRDFEGEADRFAIDYLRDNGIDPHHFATILDKLQQSHGDELGSGFFDSHPATSQRIELLESLR